jgi:tetratricopeptide (TPR) repeat protein
MALGRHRWLPGPMRCCACERPLDIVRSDNACSAGHGLLLDVPGAVCERCLPTVAGPVVTDLKATAAARLLLSLEFEIRTDRAAQFFLDLFGWQGEVVAGGAMRLHADGKADLAYRLLRDAGQAGHEHFFMVEEAALRLLDGQSGRAHELLLEAGPEDHPCWNLHHGTLAYSVGRPDAALEHWRRQVETQPDELLGWQTLGFFLLHERSDLRAAIRHFETACRRFPDHPEFSEQLEEARSRLTREGAS